MSCCFDLQVSSEETGDEWTTVDMVGRGRVPGRAAAGGGGGAVLRRPRRGERRPDQLYFGAHVLTGPIADHVHFRPNVEVGIGNDLTLVAINLEFVYQRPLQSSRWSLLVGGGPAANVFLYDEGPGHGDDSDVGGGINLLIGVSHRDGFFAEMKVGLLDSPSIKFGVGFTFGR